jgi:diacylglycerol O-acyltransferase
MQQLSGQDALFLHLEFDGFPMHIGGVVIYDQTTAPDGKVRFKDILRTFEQRLHRSPIFRRKLAMVPMALDHPYWVDDENFDLEFHIRHIALPQPGDWRQLCIQVARLHSRPLDLNRPLWEIYVIEGLSDVEGAPENSFALFIKVHHAAMDGTAGLEFVGAIHDLEPNPRPIKAAPPWEPRKLPHNIELMTRAYFNNLLKPTQMTRLVRDIFPAHQRIMQGKKKQLFRDIGEKPKTRFNGKLSPHRVVDAARFDFDDFRKIKNAVKGATINDSVLTVVSGALRKYLQAKGELPKQSVVTGCPIDVRHESEQAAGGNIVGFMNVALRTDIADPLKRLRLVHKEALSSKAYAEALGPRIAIDVADAVPGGLISLLMRWAIDAGIAESNLVQNTIVTNVPGPPVQLYLAGAELVNAFGVGPLLPTMGLFHTVTSFVMSKKGTLIIAFTSCRDVMPDPEFYAECLRDSFAELKHAVSTSRSAKIAPRSKPGAKKRTSKVTKKQRSRAKH